MELKDILWMTLIICGAVYLLYRSVWQKKGHCSGCDSGMCDMKKRTDEKSCSD